MSRGDVFNSIYDSLKRDVAEGMARPGYIRARRMAIETYKMRRERNLADLDVEQLKDRLRRIKEYSIKHIDDLLEQATHSLEELGCRVHLAADGFEAIRYLQGILGEGKLIVKSKSNTCSEIGLREALENFGCQVVETDLGEWVMQLRNERGSHPTAPALHLSRKEIAETLSRKLGVYVPPEPEDIVEIARRKLRNKLVEASIGITGANAIAAKEGIIVLVENEGNLRLVSSLPDRHVVIAGINKIVPTVEDALYVVRCQSLFSTGQVMGTYVSFVAGPSRTADIEKVLVLGAHGPKELHVILVDNGRRRALKEGFEEVLYCINCGACLADCPVYDFLGSMFGYKYFGGYGVVFTAFHMDLKSSVRHGLYLCTVCGKCKLACPSRVDIPKLIEKVRCRAVEEKMLLHPHQRIAEAIKLEGNPYGRPKSMRRMAFAKAKTTKGAGVLYYAGCTASYLLPHIVESVTSVLSKAGVSYTIMSEEECCGSILLRTGQFQHARELALRNVQKFRKMAVEEIVTTCPGCYRTFKEDYPSLVKGFHLETYHFSQYIEKLIENGMLSPKPIVKSKATYHDPCHLGRHFGEYEAPRRILCKILQNPLCEMKRSRENARCCGSGGGLRSLSPELSGAIGRQRIDDALEVDARLLITACPFCYIGLKDAIETSNARMVVRDLSELTSKAV